MHYLFEMYKEFYEILERLYGGGNSNSPDSLSPRGSVRSIGSIDSHESITSETLET